MHSAAVKRYYKVAFHSQGHCFVLIVFHQGLFMKFVWASGHYNKTLFQCYPQKINKKNWLLDSWKLLPCELESMKHGIRGYI